MNSNFFIKNPQLMEASRFSISVELALKQVNVI